MNVWIESPFDNLPHEGFRPQRYWLMAEAFAAAGHSVVYWTGDFSHASKEKRKLVCDVGEAVASVRFVPVLPYRRNVSFFRVLSHMAYARAWKKRAIGDVETGVLPKPDLIVSSMPTLSAAAAALEMGERFGAKSVVDVMDAWPDTFHRLLPGFLRPLGPFAFAGLHRDAANIYRKADFVTGVCDRYGKMVLDLGAKNYHRAYHGIELPSSVPEARNPGDGALRLVYAGNLGRTYDLGTVFEAVAADANVEFDIAGSGPLARKWRKMAASPAFGGRVRFHGYLGEQELALLLSRCHLGVVPMSADSFVGLPYKLCDYVKAGLGVVSSLEGECEEMILRHGAGAIYRPGDCASFALALEKWREQMKSARKPAFASLLSELDAGKIYREYVEFLGFGRLSG